MYNDVNCSHFGSKGPSEPPVPLDHKDQLNKYKDYKNIPAKVYETDPEISTTTAEYLSKRRDEFIINDRTPEEAAQDHCIFNMNDDIISYGDEDNMSDSEQSIDTINTNNSDISGISQYNIIDNTLEDMATKLSDENVQIKFMTFPEEDPQVLKNIEEKNRQGLL